MSLKVSTGLANHLVDTGSYRAALTGGKLLLFSSPQPASADAAHTGLLATIEGVADAGLAFTTPAVAGVISMSGVWAGVGVAAGQARSFRYCCDPDTDDGLLLSTTALRIDGSIGETGSTADATVDNTYVSVGQAVSATSFVFGVSRG